MPCLSLTSVFFQFHLVLAVLKILSKKLVNALLLLYSIYVLD